MTTHVELRRGAYADSVTLLQVSRTVQGVDGVAAAQVAMATALNVEVLTEMGFEVPAEATPNDMVVAVRLADGGSLETALAGVERALAESGRRDSGPSEEAPPRTTGRRVAVVRPDAIALVSVPGVNAFVEAMDAVESGHDVMIFSDNVPVEQEVALKQAAAEQGLLVMGPDCGTAVVGGLGLGFANVVQPGPVGLVAASGHRLPAGAGAARPRGRRGDARARRRWPRPVRRGRRAGHPRGAAAARRGRRGRARRAGLQAARARGRGRDQGLRRVAGHPGRARAAGRRAPGPDRGDRGGAAPAGPRGAVVAGGRLGRGAVRWPLPARAVRRRHHGERGEDHRDRAARAAGPRATRSWTSATTPTRPAGRTR